MSTDYQPGDRVLVHGEVVKYIDGVGACVELFSKTDQYRAWVRPDLLEPKGAVMLHLDGYDQIHGPEALRYMADRLDKGKGGNVFARIARDLADQIEAQTKPPRIPEPGLWGVVEASCVHTDQRFEWVHHSDGNWHAVGQSGGPDDWDSLIDPVLIREGLS